MTTSSESIFGERYELVSHIARGGMAQVYLAHDLFLDRPVAVKALFPELSVDEAFVQRFRREAQAAANLTHPNIVSIFDWGEGKGTYFIVMEYVDGETLSQRLRRTPMSPEEGAIVGIATASALSFAHRRNVIHRDVKPGNVLIDTSGQIKVTDFGIARAVGVSESLTQAGSVMGTASYFSPEQAQGHPVDARSDVYSLGVVLYEIIAGRAPFKGDNPVAIAYKHVKEPPPALSEFRPDVPEGYEAITMKALAKDPADRYQTADDMRADLERFRAGRQVLATLPPEEAELVPSQTTMIEPVVGAALADSTTIYPTSGGEPTDPGRGSGTGDWTSENRPSGHRSRWLAVLLALLIILGVLVFFIGKNLGLWNPGTSASASVPSVSGQPLGEAKLRLQEAGFNNIKVQVVVSTMAKGDAVGTVPPSGTSEHKSNQILLQVSGGPVQIKVPDLHGQPLAQAKSQLTKDKLKYSIVYVTNNSVTQGDVVRTDPGPNKLVAQGSTVKLVVSGGPRMVVVPSVTGQSPSAAYARLEDLGFHVVPGQEASNTVQSGLVAGTNPTAGQSIPYGQSITVLISTGPATVNMPSLVGKSSAEAFAILNRRNLGASVSYETVTDPNENGIVLSTNPIAGSQVQAGGTVELVVGQYTVPTTTAPATTTTVPTTTTTVPSTTTTTTTTTTTLPPRG